MNRRKPLTEEQRRNIKADNLARALIDRLFDMEKRIASFEENLNEHFEMIAEIQPKISADGTVTMRAMKATEEAANEYEVSFNPVTTTKL